MPGTFFVNETVNARYKIIWFFYKKHGTTVARRRYPLFDKNKKPRHRS